jgi:hypothetical protein
VSVHWCMLCWTVVIPTIAELANTYSSNLTTFMVIRARLIPHVIILAYSNSKFMSKYITHTWSDFHMVKSQLNVNDWLVVQIRMCTHQWLALYWGKKFHANRHVANWQDFLLLDPLEQSKTTIEQSSNSSTLVKDLVVYWNFADEQHALFNIKCFKIPSFEYHLLIHFHSHHEHFC